MIIEKCPKCGQETLIVGYGLLGGGIGTYEMCDDEACGYFHKEQDKSSEPGSSDPSCFHG